MSAAEAVTAPEPGDPCPVCGNACAACAEDLPLVAIILTFDDGLELPPGGRILVRRQPWGDAEGDVSKAGESWMPVVFSGGRVELAP